MANLITNGTFDDDSWWTDVGTGWNIGGSGVATFTGADYEFFSSPALDIAEKEIYRLNMTTTTTQGSPLVVYLGGNFYHIESAGTHTLNYLQVGSVSTKYLRFYPGSYGTRWQGTIDNVELHKVEMYGGIRDRQKQMAGQEGSVLIDRVDLDVTAPPGKVFIAIKLLENCKFHSDDGSYGGGAGGLVTTDTAKYINSDASSTGGGGTGGQTVGSGNTFQSGTMLYGRWTSIALHTGKCIAYVGT